MREAKYDALKDSFYNENDVFGACQLFRRACFEEIGGYTPIKWGGIDWIAVRTARLKGWQTRSFWEKLFYHHRPMGATESNTWKARFDYGRKDYFLGNHPLWQVFRVSFQMMKTTLRARRTCPAVRIFLLVCVPHGKTSNDGITKVPSPGAASTP